MISVNDTDQRERFEIVLRDTQALVRAYIAGMGVAPADVDDVAQEVYIVFHRDLEKMPADVQPIRWLKGIARNLCLKHFRKDRTERRHVEQLFDTLAAAADQTDLLRSRAPEEQLFHCMDKLSPKNRTILQLRYEAEQTSEAIAEKLGTTASAVRITLLRVREWLRKCIEQTSREGSFS